MAAFEITITEIRKKKIVVYDKDYDFEAERKVEEDYVSGKIDMDIEPTDWKIESKEI